SPVVEAVESFHLRRLKGRNTSRIQSPSLQRPRPDFAGMRIDGLKPFSHFGQSFGAAHPGARPQKLAATAAVFPPKGDPVPASTGLAFLQTAALKTTATGSDGFRNHDHVAHGRRL